MPSCTQLRHAKPYIISTSVVFAIFMVMNAFESQNETITIQKKELDLMQKRIEAVDNVTTGVVVTPSQDIVNTKNEHQDVQRKSLYAGTCENGGSIDLKYNKKIFIKQFAKIYNNESLLAFNPTLTVGEFETLLMLVKAFTETAERYDLTYMIMYGSWLGSLRHHGLIPWDEDFDFLMDFDQKEKISEVLSTKLPEPCQIRRGDEIWRLSAKNATNPGDSWTFPYLDIYFFTDQDGIFHHSKGETIDVDRNQIFPLRRRPFFDMCVPVPRNNTIGISLLKGNRCMSKKRSHKSLPRMKVMNVDCDVMYPLYPFVFRTPVNESWTNETLVMNGKLLHWILVKN